MGDFSFFNHNQKKIDELMCKDFEARVNGFNQEYETLVSKYRCIHQSILDFVGNGNLGIVPKLIIINYEKEIKKENVK